LIPGALLFFIELFNARSANVSGKVHQTLRKKKFLLPWTPKRVGNEVESTVLFNRMEHYLPCAELKPTETRIITLLRFAFAFADVIEFYNRRSARVRKARDDLSRYGLSFYRPCALGMGSGPNALLKAIEGKLRSL
jgi:hypothetical protein